MEGKREDWEIKMKGALVLYVLRYVLLTARLHLGDNSRASKVLTIKYLPLLEDLHVCVLEKTFCFQQNIFIPFSTSICKQQASDFLLFRGYGGQKMKTTSL